MDNNNTVTKPLNIGQQVEAALQATPAIKAEKVRSDARYLELRQLNAVANYHAVKEFKVSTKLAVPAANEITPVVCHKTGTTVMMQLPRIPGFALTYESPLALYTNVKGLIALGRDYLTALDAQVLAGLWLTAYKHYDLLVISRERTPEAVAINAMLRTAGKTILVDGLELIGHIDSRNKDRLPHFSLEYSAHKEFMSVGPALQEYNRSMRDVIYPSAESFYSKSKEAKELRDIEAAKYQDNASYVLKQPKKAARSNAEREYEEQFILNRREAKLILARMTEDRTVPGAFIAKLKPVFVGKNLVAMSEATRRTVAAKLRTYATVDSERLAVIIEKGYDPYDTDDAFDDAFTTNEANLAFETAAPKRKLSLKEILEARKTGVSPVDQVLAVAVVDTDAVEAIPVLRYNPEDAIRHEEIEQSLDEGNMISKEDADWNHAYIMAMEGQTVVAPTEEQYAMHVDIDGEDF